MKTPIYDRIRQLKTEGDYPFHMPGHKRCGDGLFEGVYSADVTEIEGFDDLHHPEGIIRESMNSWRDFYKTRETYLLVNGSSGGILAAMRTLFSRGDKVLVARNCHKSVYYGLLMLGLIPVYVFPEVDEDGVCLGITKVQVENAVKDYPDISGAVLVSPTYEGRVSDVAGISQVLQHRGMSLLVDEAHGAHFPFSELFSQSATELGADIVIQSVHKTLPAMTQTALLHVCSKDVSLDKMQKNLSMFQTSSPSYILMASAEYAIAQAAKAEDQIDKYVDALKQARKMLEQMKHFHLIFADDLGKIVVSVKDTNYNGKQLMEVLRDHYHMELEMAEVGHVIAMTSFVDEPEKIRRLAEALRDIDDKAITRKWESFSCNMPQNQQVLTPKEAEERSVIRVKIPDALNCVASEFVFLYPPGIPLLVPGERINAACIERILEYEKRQMKVVGVVCGELSVIDERL